MRSGMKSGADEKMSRYLSSRAGGGQKRWNREASRDLYIITSYRAKYCPNKQKLVEMYLQRRYLFKYKVSGILFLLLRNAKSAHSGYRVKANVSLKEPEGLPC